VDGAIAAFRQVIHLKADYAEAHCNLGQILQNKGQFTEALAHLRRGHELGTKQPGWRIPSAEWVRKAERMVALEKNLPAILHGEAQPADTPERLTLAKMCAARAWHAAAVRLWADAFAADPRRAGDLNTQDRYNAACSAALAGCGFGNDDPPPGDAAREKLRRQALAWLRADLAAYIKLLAGANPQAPALVRQRLQHWQRDVDFRGVRGDDALAKLPEAERQDWQQLWQDVEALVRRATKGGS
jgi:serine/threonine-protein kinase